MPPRVSHRARDITRGMENFERNGDYKILITVLNALKLVPLRESHFTKTESALLGFKNAMAEVLDHNFSYSKNRPINRRKLLFQMLTMSNLMVDENMVAPVTFRFSIEQKRAVSCIHAFPLQVSAFHTERQHVTRTPDALDYSGDDFLFSALFSLPLCSVIEKYLPAGDIGSVPFCIPHRRGFYKARAGRQIPYLHATEYVYGGSPKNSYVADVQGDALEMPVTATIKTSINTGLFTESQLDLYRAFRPFREEERLRNALTKGLAIYAAGSLASQILPEDDIRDWNNARDRLEEIVASPVWRNEVEEAKRTETAPTFG